MTAVVASPRAAPVVRFARAAGHAAGHVVGAVLVLWIAATVAFAGLRVAPGDTVDTIIGEGPDSAAIRSQVVAEWGLDRPAVVQYLTYLWRLSHGDLGRSYVLQRPVGDVLSDQIGPTVTLTLAAVVLGALGALALAVATAGRRPVLRWLAGAAELTAVSVPVFLVGMVLLSVFSFRLGWFPVAGVAGPGALVLPAVTLALPVAGVLAQVLREGLERALEEPFSLTARSRGITEAALLLRHALRHAAAPAVTLTGWLVGLLLGGTVIVETVFGRPGLGQVAVDAVLAKDIPVVLAVVMFSAVTYVAASTAADLTHRLIDPRLRTARPA